MTKITKCNCEIQQEIERLKSENITLHKCLEEVIAFCLDLCEQDNCAGDYNTGISPCIMWKDGDIDNDGNLTKADCLLKNIKRLKKEVASSD